MLGGICHRRFGSVGQGTIATFRTITTFTTLAAVTVTRTAGTITVLRRRSGCRTVDVGVDARDDLRIRAVVQVVVCRGLAFHTVFGAGTPRTTTTATAAFVAFATFTSRCFVAAWLLGDQRRIGTDGTQCSGVDHGFGCG